MVWDGNCFPPLPFSIHMPTPPYHFSIVSAPFVSAGHGLDAEILYRGSIPAARNLPFLRRLQLGTLVYLQNKELKADDGLMRWARMRGVEMKWIKVEGMVEESLGMGRTEVGQVLRVCIRTFCP